MSADPPTQPESRDQMSSGEMRMTKFTPGPWSATPGDRTGFKTASGNPSIIAQARPTDDFFVLKIAELDTNVPVGEIEPNAHLIAAAPDLYEALQGAINVIEGQPDPEHVAYAIEAGRAALSRARGEKG